MKVYLDVLFLLNFAFDFLLLLSVAILLRRTVTWKRLFLAAMIGGMSLFVLFLRITSFQLFLIKFAISVLMILVAFGFHDKGYFFKNLFFLYTSSIILGGFLYYLNVEFSYKQEGLVFYHNGLSVNMIFLIIFSPLILYIYIRQGIRLKNYYSNCYPVIFHIQDKTVRLNGFLDTGNLMQDPISKRPIVLVNSLCFPKKVVKEAHYYVPYQTANGHGVLPCISIDFMEITGVGIRQKVLVALLPDRIGMEGADCILNSKIMEG